MFRYSRQSLLDQCIADKERVMREVARLESEAAASMAEIARIDGALAGKEIEFRGHRAGARHAPDGRALADAIELGAEAYRALEALRAGRMQAVSRVAALRFRIAEETRILGEIAGALVYFEQDRDEEQADAMREQQSRDEFEREDDQRSRREQERRTRRQGS